MSFQTLSKSPVATTNASPHCFFSLCLQKFILSHLWLKDSIQVIKRSFTDTNLKINTNQKANEQHNNKKEGPAEPPGVSHLSSRDADPGEGSMAMHCISDSLWMLEKCRAQLSAVVCELRGPHCALHFAFNYCKHLNCFKKKIKMLQEWKNGLEEVVKMWKCIKSRP